MVLLVLVFCLGLVIGFSLGILGVALCRVSGEEETPRPALVRAYGGATGSTLTAASGARDPQGSSLPSL